MSPMRRVDTNPRPVPVAVAAPQYVVVNQPLRILELLGDVTRGSRCQVSRGDDQVLAGTLVAATVAGRSSGALQMDVHFDGPTVDPAAWAKASIYLWVPHPSGILAARVPVLRAEPAGLRLGLPSEIVRYVRRADPRVTLPDFNPIRLGLPLADGGWADSVRVIDLSVSGMRIEVTADVHFPPDAQTTAALYLHKGGPLYVMVRCAFDTPTAEGTRLVGLQFVEPSATVRMALERFMKLVTRHLQARESWEPAGDTGALDAALA